MLVSLYFVCMQKKPAGFTSMVAMHLRDHKACLKRDTRTAMKIRLVLLTVFVAAVACAQTQPVLGEDSVKVSDHVSAIMGWPNIGIVVGSRAVLVVDTGLGPR